MVTALRCDRCRKVFQPEEQADTQYARCPKCGSVVPASGVRLPYDVFVSYANKNGDVARKACETLEERGVRCWIASRDIGAGQKWLEAIAGAIGECRAVVFVFSSHANASDWVERELALACDKKAPIISLRIEDAPPSKGLEVLLKLVQWLDALTPPLENHLALLADAVRKLLDEGPPPPPPSPPPAPPPAPPPSDVKLTNAAVLREGRASFRQGEVSRVPDESVRNRLVAARGAIEEVAAIFDASWQRGRHTLAEEEVRTITVPPNDKLTTVLALRILNVIVRHLNDVSEPCRIESDEGGLIQKEGDLVQRKGGRQEEVRDATHTWVIDPIDGSRHLMRHLPVFTTTMALVNEHYETILAMIYAPITGELFFAVRGCGAFLNDWDAPLQVSGREPDNAYVYAEFPNVDTQEGSQSEFNRRCKSLKRIFRTFNRVRGFGLGSMGMAYVAKGAFDAYVTLSGKTRKCDVLAGALLVNEAGGRAEIVAAHAPAQDRPESLTDVYAVGGNAAAYARLMADKKIAGLFNGNLK